MNPINIYAINVYASANYDTTGSDNSVSPVQLLRTKPLTESLLAYCRLDPWKPTSVKFNRNAFIFIDERVTCLHLPEYRMKAYMLNIRVLMKSYEHFLYTTDLSEDH